MNPIAAFFVYLTAAGLSMAIAEWFQNLGKQPDGRKLLYEGLAWLAAIVSLVCFYFAASGMMQYFSERHF